MIRSQLPVLLFAVPFVAALVVAAVAWLHPSSARWIAVAALSVTAALAIAAAPRVVTEGTLQSHLGGWPPPIGIELLIDPLSAFMAIVVGVIALVVVAGALPQASQELPHREVVYYACILLLVSGLMGMVVTGDLFNMFVQLEVASLSAYALVAAGGRGAPRAALTYLIIGSLGASLYLTGVGFLYAATGSLNIADVAGLIGSADPRLVRVAGLLIVVGLGVKMALFPLHMWMPAAYAHAPTAAASFMAPLVTKVAAYALIRVMFWVFGGGSLASEPVLLEILAWAGAVAMVGGGILAMLQEDFRRMLAYSSISQMGLIALGVGLATTAGMTGAVLHIASDALMKGVLFLAAGVAWLRFGVRDVGDLSQLRGQAPWTAAAIVVAGLSLIGVPPLSGFFGKWYVLSATLADSRWALAAALVAGSLATIAYVFRIVEQLFFTAAPATGPAREGTVPVAACVVLAIGVILLGLGNERVVSLLVMPALPTGAP